MFLLYPIDLFLLPVLISISSEMKDTFVYAHKVPAVIILEYFNRSGIKTKELMFERFR